LNTQVSKRVIAGIDNSINSPGVIKFYCDEFYNVEKIDYLGFTDKKKYKNIKNILWLSKKEFNNNLEQNEYSRRHIIEFLNDVSHVGIEDYAHGMVGRVTDLAECCGCLKYELFKQKIKIRVYNVFSIKKFALGKAKPDKELVIQQFIKDGFFDRIFEGISEVDLKNSPFNDIIDAFYITRLLKEELRIKEGIIKVTDLPKEKREVFISKNKKGFSLLQIPFI